MYRLARCLFDLNRSIEADKVLKNFQEKFPDYASNSACKALKMDIKEAIDSGNIIKETLLRKFHLFLMYTRGGLVASPIVRWYNSLK